MKFIIENFLIVLRNHIFKFIATTVPFLLIVFTDHHAIVEMLKWFKTTDTTWKVYLL